MVEASHQVPTLKSNWVWEVEMEEEERCSGEFGKGTTGGQVNRSLGLKHEDLPVGLTTAPDRLLCFFQAPYISLQSRAINACVSYEPNHCGKSKRIERVFFWFSWLRNIILAPSYVKRKSELISTQFCSYFLAEQADKQKNLMWVVFSLMGVSLIKIQLLFH